MEGDIRTTTQIMETLDELITSPFSTGAFFNCTSTSKQRFLSQVPPRRIASMWCRRTDARAAPIWTGCAAASKRLTHSIMEALFALNI